MTATGFFLVLDGIDGCGKTTQSKRAAEYLQQEGFRVTTARDPGSTPLGEKIRALLLGDEAPIGPRAELLLYLASRAQLMESVVLPALARNEIVVLDRFVSSTFAYQGALEFLDSETLLTQCRFSASGRLPDLSLLLDLSVAAAFARMDRAQDRIEQRGTAYFEKVRQGFLDYARREKNTRLVDATPSPDQVTRQVIEQIETMRPLFKGCTR